MRVPPRPTLFPYTTLFRSGGLELASELLDGYRRGRGGGRPARVPAPVSELLTRVAARKRRELLEKRTVAVGERRSEEHTSELQSLRQLVCRLLLEKKTP